MAEEVHAAALLYFPFLSKWILPRGDGRFFAAGCIKPASSIFFPIFFFFFFFFFPSRLAPFLSFLRLSRFTSSYIPSTLRGYISTWQTVTFIFKLGDPRSACIYPSYVSGPPVRPEDEIYFLSASAAVADIAMIVAARHDWRATCSIMLSYEFCALFS